VRYAADHAIRPYHDAIANFNAAAAIDERIPINLNVVSNTHFGPAPNEYPWVNHDIPTNPTQFGTLPSSLCVAAFSVKETPDSISYAHDVLNSPASARAAMAIFAFMLGDTRERHTTTLLSPSPLGEPSETGRAPKAVATIAS
jgi:hypothetical protein